jgi:hypothetical protein
MDPSSELMLLLADPAVRATVLDEAALLAVISVSYDVDPATITGPVTAIYDRVDVAVPIVPETAVALRVTRAGDALPWDITGSWDGPTLPAPGADLVWTGSIVLATGGGSGTVTDLAGSEPNLDAVFVAPLSALPPTATEDQIRAALRQAAENDVAAPALTDTELDNLLAVLAPGAADPRAMGRSVSGRDLVGLQLQMSPLPGAADAVPVALPVVVAFLVADATTAPRDLLRATALARRAARGYPVPPVPSGAPARLADRCVCWVLPATAFDDTGWPGGSGADAAAQRASRLAAARAWLASQGIAIVTTT